MATADITATPEFAPAFDLDRQRRLANRAIAKHSFCTLATTSSALRPHVVGMRYVEIDGALYVTMFDESIKARNIRENNRVAVCIPARKLPMFPPFAVQFQGTAEILSGTDPRIVQLFESGRFKAIISTKDFEDPHTCFARIVPARRISTFGIGVPLLQIVREPTSAIRSFER
jgi:nitroimidazol reductase NimA-like FMN-containing flavoprotein (pyridoxamine 5'-phosphate oxidase superfamily)